ncbi:MAG: hypothetical protein Q8M91_02310 [Polaromonas sp.]|nr:hypothetical protein [Polaromonas sp.]
MPNQQGSGNSGLAPHPANETGADVPPLANAELVQLQVRVIALENLLIALLAEASDSQRRLARDMASYISPRPGYTPHTLTLHAATQMLHLIERGELFSVNAGDT